MESGKPNIHNPVVKCFIINRIRILSLVVRNVKSQTALLVTTIKEEFSTNNELLFTNKAS